MSQLTLDILVGIAMLVGVAGIIVPVLPGVLLVGIALLAWGVLTGSPTAWIVTIGGLAVLGLGQVLKYLLPGRKMSAAGVPGRSMIAGGLLAIVGFFAIPVVGVFVGFILGVYLAEQWRLRDWRGSWNSTWVTMKATGFSILIELATALLVIAMWAAAAVAT